MLGVSRLPRPTSVLFTKHPSLYSLTTDGNKRALTKENEAAAGAATAQAQQLATRRKKINRWPARTLLPHTEGFKEEGRGCPGAVAPEGAE